MSDPSDQSGRLAETGAEKVRMLHMHIIMVIIIAV